MKKAIALLLVAISVLGLVGCNEAPPSDQEPDFLYYYNFEDYGQNTDTLKPIAEKFGKNKAISPNANPEVLTYTEIPEVENNAKGPDPICIVLPDLDLAKYDGPYLWMDEATGLEVSAYYRVVANMLTDEMVKVFVDSAGNIIQYETVNLGKYDALNLDTEQIEYAQTAFRDMIHTTFQGVLQEVCPPKQHHGLSAYEVFTDDEGQLVITTRLVLKNTIVTMDLYSVISKQ